MCEEKETAHRLAAYSDAVFAMIVTMMVLELRAPEQATFSDLSPLWPTAISYAVSYRSSPLSGFESIRLYPRPKLY